VLRQVAPWEDPQTKKTAATRERRSYLTQRAPFRKRVYQKKKRSGLTAHFKRRYDRVEEELLQGNRLWGGGHYSLSLKKKNIVIDEEKVGYRHRVKLKQYGA